VNVSVTNSVDIGSTRVAHQSPQLSGYILLQSQSDKLYTNPYSAGLTYGEHQAYYNGYQSLPDSMLVDLGVLFLNKTRVVGAIKNLGDGACIERLLDQNSNRVTKEVWLATESNQPIMKGDLHASDNHEESKYHD
jgi:hypothetical protein